MRRTGLAAATILLLGACAHDTETPWNPLDDYEEVDAATIIDAPSAQPGTFAPETRGQVERGEYLVELLGCGSCHTDGALDGAPDLQRALAGSATGIAYANPLSNDRPGVVYPSNLTPDKETGLGSWSDRQIANAIRAGIGTHGSRRIAAMPWQGYAKISDDDVVALVAYLRSIKPVRHDVPKEVMPGDTARSPYVYFGVYRNKR
jgi:mono/diheme cytochrome c family protein